MAEQKDTLAKLREAVVPAKRDPHPCVTRCWRVGGPVELDARGKCQECGLPTDINTSPTCELPRATVLKLLAVVEAAKGMRWNGVMTAFGGVNPYAEVFDAALAALDGGEEGGGR